MNAPALTAPAMPYDDETELDKACFQLQIARTAETLATRDRLNAEKAVLDAFGALQPEGTQHNEGAIYKATVVSRIERKVEDVELRKIARTIPVAIGERLIRWTPSLNLAELRHLQANEPEIYATLSSAITARPAKPSVSVERMGER